MRKTPPPRPLSTPDTPIHKLSTTTDRFNPKFQNRDMVFHQLARDMTSFFIGPIPPGHFLESFLPLDPLVCSTSTFEPGILSALEGAKDEKHLQTMFVRPNAHHSVLLATDLFQSHIVSPYVSPGPDPSVESAGPRLDLVNARSQHDQDNPMKFPFHPEPDCTVYDSKSPHNNRLDSSLVECLIEFKMGSEHDPFVQDVSLRTVNTDQGLLMGSSSCRKMAGQITAYATWILSAQYRTHLFFILIFKKYLRLIRWDRSGAVFTVLISHSEMHVLNFLTLFKDASPQVCSHDITIKHASKGDEVKARELKELTNARSLLCIFIPGRPSSSCKPSRYIVKSLCS